jgi:hypothetical protein
MFRARSILYHPSYEETIGELSDQIILPIRTYLSFMRQFQDEPVLYVNLIHTENNIKFLVAINTSHDYDSRIIYVPPWILEHIGPSDEFIFDVEKATVDNIPIATHIIARPLDSDAFQYDLTSLVEIAMMNLHSIQQNCTLPIQTPDGEFYLYIETVEPAPLSRIVNGEVTVEFIRDDLDRPATPIPDAFGDGLAVPPPVTTDVVPTEISSEEMRRQVRDAWSKRFA